MVTPPSVDCRASTLSTHGPDGFHIQLSEEDRKAVFDSINVEQAVCFKPEDTAMILGRVVELYGSHDNFDALLKLYLLLQPLSYRADIRALVERVEDTKAEHPENAAVKGYMNMAPVEDWLWENTRSRVLVITGGAGEGKSTISAALGKRFGAPVATAAGSASEPTAPAAAGTSATGTSIGVVTHNPTPVVLAYHFLKYNDARRLDPVRIVQSLAFQLAAARCLDGSAK